MRPLHPPPDHAAADARRRSPLGPAGARCHFDDTAVFPASSLAHLSALFARFLRVGAGTARRNGGKAAEKQVVKVSSEGYRGSDEDGGVGCGELVLYVTPSKHRYTQRLLLPMLDAITTPQRNPQPRPGILGNCTL